MSKIQMVLRADHLPDPLIVGPTEVVTNHRSLTGKRRLERGTVVGVIAESGAMTICTKDASDGSQVPSGILAGDYHCKGGDIPRAAVFEGGDFNANAIVLDASLSQDDVYEPLLKAGITLWVIVSPGGIVL